MLVSRFLSRLPIILERECRCHTYENDEQLKCKVTEQRPMLDYTSTKR